MYLYPKDLYPNNLFSINKYNLKTTLHYTMTRLSAYFWNLLSAVNPSFILL